MRALSLSVAARASRGRCQMTKFPGESGAIAHEKRGRHRRVTLRDLVEYQQQFRVERRAKLTDLAREGQRSGIIPLDPPTIKRVTES